MDFTWTVLCALALTTGRGALANSKNSSSFADDLNTEPAYYDWNLGMDLSAPSDYVGAATLSAPVSTSWQQFYELKAGYQAQKLSGRSSTAAGNTTLAIAITAKMDDKWNYTSHTSCATVLVKPCVSCTPDFVPEHGLHLLDPVASGLVPITCGLLDASQPAAADNVLCNAIYKPGAAYIFPAGTEPVSTLDKDEAQHWFSLGNIVMPMSRGNLLLSERENFEWVKLEHSTFISIDPAVKYMADKQIDISLSYHVGLGKAERCADNELLLMLPLQGILLEGVALYCYQVQWSSNTSDIVVMAWDHVSYFLGTNASQSHCGRILDIGRFMLVLYGGIKPAADLSADDPFQYMYRFEQGADQKWNVTCTAQWYQKLKYRSDDLNRDRLEFLGATTLPLWENLSSCVTGIWDAVPAVFNDLDYDVGQQLRVHIDNQVIQPDGFGLSHDGHGVLYPHNSPQSMGPLQGSIFTNNTLKLASSGHPGFCVLKDPKRESTDSQLGSDALAKESISSLLGLGIDSGYGAQNLPLIRQQINDMSSQFSALSLAGAVNAAITSIVAAYGFNAFTFKVSFLKARNAVLLVIRVFVSVVEAGLASAAAITVMWELKVSGTASRQVQWVNSQKETPCDFELCSHYIFTTAWISGSADYLIAQWVILAVGMLLSTLLIMYRWHFARGGSLSDWVNKLHTEQETLKVGLVKVSLRVW